MKVTNMKDCWAMSFLVKKLYERHRDKIKIAIQCRNGNKICKKMGIKTLKLSNVMSHF
jgi:hypothetical protein